ncbi:MAG: hypothetical protein EHM70_05575 [Chloroflexota bacterium]|nr:MAG: hypothetical protein EHM70_05575 [Chloroflexota bacterium]
MKDNLDDVVERPRRYWKEDGLAELVIGTLFLLAALLFYIQTLSAAGSIGRALIDVLIPLLLVGMYLGSKRLVEMIKSRLTYPRTGYVAYRRPERKHSRLAIAVALTATLLITGVVFAVGPQALQWIPLLDGVLLGIIFIFIGQGAVRFSVLAAVSLLSGIALALQQVGGYLGHAAFFGLAGLALIVSGGLTLWSYLYRTRDLKEAANEQ